jgi:hypothetical protein
MRFTTLIDAALHDIQKMHGKIITAYGMKIYIVSPKGSRTIPHHNEGIKYKY